jgi:hypothetical protein
MARLLQKFALFLTLFAILSMEPAALANPVGDFFKKIGRSISHLGHSAAAPKDKHKGGSKTPAAAGDRSEHPEVAHTATSPTPTPVDIRPAAMAPADPRGRRDVPFGVAVPNKPGFVTSPYAPTLGLVDVRAFPSSTEVLDPFTGKIFLTP